MISAAAARPTAKIPISSALITAPPRRLVCGKALVILSINALMSAALRHVLSGKRRGRFEAR